MSINNYNPSIIEINYNLDILQKTLDRKITVDPGFFKIFSEATQRLPLNQEQQALANRIKQLSKRQPAAAASFVPHVVKHVGAEEALSNRADESRHLFIKRHLTTLSEDYNFRRVRGDGHCLFRSMAAGYMMSCQHLSPQERQAKIDALKDIMQDENYHLPQDTQNYIYDMISGINPENINDYLNHEQLSNFVVSVLRTLSSNYNRINPSETFQQMLQTKNLSAEEYCQRMEDMQQAAYGGNPELHALSVILDTSFSVYTASSNTWTLFEQNPNTPPIALLLTPQHYDLLIPKDKK